MSAHPMVEGLPGKAESTCPRSHLGETVPRLVQNCAEGAPTLGGRAVGGVPGSLPAGNLGGLSLGPVACFLLCDSLEVSSLPGLSLLNCIGWQCTVSWKWPDTRLSLTQWGTTGIPYPVYASISLGDTPIILISWGHYRN